MDAFSDPLVETVVVMSSSQVGKTEVLNNVAGFHMQRDPCPMLVVQPTIEFAGVWSSDRLAPMIRDTPVLYGLVSEAKSRNSKNTIKRKAFPGGYLAIVGANSSVGLSGRPVRLVLLDEVDRYPASAGPDGDPVNLTVARTTNFWNRKIGLFSTPTIKNFSRIEAAFEQSDMRFYHVPCPHCGTFQPLRWERVKFDNNDPKTARYQCAECDEKWTDLQRHLAVKRGEWRATAPFNGVAGFHIWAAYSPWVSLSSIVDKFLKAKGNPETLKVFVNTVLGRSWESKSDSVDANAIPGRGEDWDDKAPAGVSLVTLGIDTQLDRAEIERVGYGAYEESWSLEYVVIPGDPSTPDFWRQVLDYVRKPTITEDGRTLFPSATCIDSGGAFTDEVYRFAGMKHLRPVWAIKGVGGPGRPIWRHTKRFSKKSGNTPFYIVGVDAAKDVVFAHLTIPKAGPGFCHFPKSRGPDYFEMLTAEQAVTKYTKGVPERVYAKKTPGARNEALDCRVYALAAVRSLAINWARIVAARTGPPPAEAKPAPAAAVVPGGVPVVSPTPAPPLPAATRPVKPAPRQIRQPRFGRPPLLDR